MAYEEGVNMNMPVAPAYGGNGFGGIGDGWWIILLILCMNNGMWGGFGGNGGNSLYPWLNQSDQMNSGFQNQMLQSSISEIIGSISGGFASVQNALCSGFASVTSAVVNAQYALSQQMNNNTMAEMERSFQLQSQLAQCCCENRAATADLKYTIAQEACADRAAVADAMQRILDTMCQNTIDAKNEKIADLERQVTTAEIINAIRNQGCGCGCNQCNSCGNF